MENARTAAAVPPLSTPHYGKSSRHWVAIGLPLRSAAVRFVATASLRTQFRLTVWRREAGLLPAKSRRTGRSRPSQSLARALGRVYKAAASRSRRRRSVAQPGSAPRSGRGGRRFESSHSDHFSIFDRSLRTGARMFEPPVHLARTKSFAPQFARRRATATLGKKRTVAGYGARYTL